MRRLKYSFVLKESTEFHLVLFFPKFGVVAGIIKVEKWFHFVGDENYTTTVEIKGPLVFLG
jgi:hypothetical protein